MKCKNCGAELAEWANFCGECGTPVASNKEQAEVYISKLEDDENPAQEDSKEVIEDTKVEEKFEDPISDSIKELDEHLQRHREDFHNEVENDPANEEKIIITSDSNKNINDEAKDTNSSVEVKPAGLVKPIALAAMVLLIIFVLVYIIDLLGVIFNFIGGIF